MTRGLPPPFVIPDLARDRVRRIPAPFQEPADQPRQDRFDLVVLHEMGLSYDAASWAEIAGLVRAGLTEDATVVACHWKHDEAYSLAAETVHGMLNSVLGLPRQTRVADTDFILDVWTTTAASIARREGLL